MPAVTREVVIDTDIETAAVHLAFVPNLATWTTFFQSVGAQTEGRYAVESIMGPIETWIERTESSNAIRLTICSLIRGVVEHAFLDLGSDAASVRVRFEVTLPDHLPAVAISEQHVEMGEELAELKRLLEARHATV